MPEATLTPLLFHSLAELKRHMQVGVQLKAVEHLAGEACRLGAHGDQGSIGRVLLLFSRMIQYATGASTAKASEYTFIENGFKRDAPGKYDGVHVTKPGLDAGVCGGAGGLSMSASARFPLPYAFALLGMAWAVLRFAGVL